MELLEWVLFGTGTVLYIYLTFVSKNTENKWIDNIKPSWFAKLAVNTLVYVLLIIVWLVFFNLK